MTHAHPRFARSGIISAPFSFCTETKGPNRPDTCRQTRETLGFHRRRPCGLFAVVLFFPWASAVEWL